jgi:hypothetical protein
LSASREFYQLFLGDCAAAGCFGDLTHELRICFRQDVFLLTLLHRECGFESVRLSRPDLQYN